MNKLKFFREINNYTQQEIADKLFINQNTYSRYESEPIKTPEEILEKLSEIYNVPKQTIQNNDPFIIITNATNGYIQQITNQNNYPKELVEKLLEAKDEIITSLKLEIEKLRE